MGHLLSTPRRLVLAVVLVLIALPAPAQAAEPLTRSFFGTVVDGPLLEADAPVEQELALMRESGLGLIRLPVHWNAIQPYPSWDAVPEAERGDFVDLEGVPTDVRLLDRWIVGAAKLDMDVLAVAVRTPWWAAVDPQDQASPPKGVTTYQRFLRGLIKRYGPKGSVWQAVPAADRRPVRDWQIWNEPAIKQFWSGEDWARGYVRLLRSAYNTVKATDPGSRVFLAGMTNDAWNAVDWVYGVGGKGYFDVAAVHPYSGRVASIVKTVRRTRKVMARYKDPKRPLAVTEMSWTSSAGKVQSNQPWDGTEATQAKRLGQAFSTFARQRGDLRLTSISWYTWLSPSSGEGVFSFAGLRVQTPSGNASKPALMAMRDTIRRLARR